MSDYENASFFQQIKIGLKQSIAHARGELSLRTTELPVPPPSASPRRVAALRRRLGMSQSVFAALLNVSPKLVQGWEQGLRIPRGGDLRLIQILDENLDVVRPWLVPAGPKRSVKPVMSRKPRRSRQTSAAA